MKSPNKRRIAVALMVLAAAACRPLAVRPPALPPAPPIDTAGAVRYQVDGAASDVHVLVYRGGTMARLGHNHVVSSKDVTGTLWLHRDLSRSRVELILPVASLIVDDPQARSTEGEEFAVEVPVDAREGTRRNLLRAEVLDADRYPTITLQSMAVAGTRVNPELTLRITIKGAVREVVVPATLQEQGERITASGQFTVKQTDFGITPFSIALGAVQVQDQLRVKFSIVCRQQQ